MSESGESLFSKCYRHKCNLGRLDSKEATNLIKTLREVQKRRPSSRIHTINFESLKLLVEIREQLGFFIEIKQKDKEEKIRTFIKQIIENLEAKLRDVEPANYGPKIAIYMQENDSQISSY